MTRFVVVRPEPGNAATVAGLRAAGLEALACPLFAVVPLAWSPPGPAAFDALLITSANAIRHAGADLARLAALPVIAVGEASADAARAAGLAVAAVGAGDARTAIDLARAAGYPRLLHLAGRDRSPATAEVAAVMVYANEALPVPPDVAVAWLDGTILLHSARAARRVAELAGDGRGSIALVGLSEPVIAAAGPGWRAAMAADRATDAALLDLARRRAD